MRIADASLGQLMTVRTVGGERAFRRRIMELGLVPGTPVQLVGVAPLGDPLELRVRGCRLSIRRSEAAAVHVSPLDAEQTSSGARSPTEPAPLSSRERLARGRPNPRVAYPSAGLPEGAE